MGCQTSLTTEVTERDSETWLRSELSGAVSHRQAVVTATAPVGTKDAGSASRDELAQRLSRDLAAKLTDEVWADAGADEAGMRAAAPDRFADGEKAMAAGRYREAATEFAAALAGQPENPDYISAAADAEIAQNRASEALPLLARLAALRGGDREVLLRLGDAALLAGDADQAEGAFLRAAGGGPPDPRALEGVARAARAKHDFARSVDYYGRLLTGLGVLRAPAMGPVAAGGAPDGGEAAGPEAQLPGILAHMPDDSVRLTAAPASGVELPIARAYFSAGYASLGVRALAAYQTPDRPPYADRDYLALAADLDKASDAIASRVGVITEMPTRELTGDALSAEVHDLHDQSDRLASLVERMKASPRLDPAHRYRVLAYNLLNQSDFEAMMYFDTHDSDRKRRADLLRDAFRKARSQAQVLASELSGTVGGVEGSGPAVGG
jgi:tetratricopeptide (TPR) repeat protein